MWRLRARINRRLHPWLSYSLRRELLDDAMETIRHRMTGCVLEIGAGHVRRRGRFIPPVTEVPRWIFSDISAHQRPDLQADTQKLPFPKETFQTVLCMEVLEYVRVPDLAIQEMHRVLRIDGTLILTLPFLHRWDSDHDLWRITRPGLELLLRKSGFIIESIENQGGPFGVIVNISRFLLAKYPRSRTWWFWVCLLYPVLRWMESFDSVIVKKLPVFATFTTGFVILARKGSGSLLSCESLSVVQE